MSRGTFAQYARYYDLLYRDKDYFQEARSIDALLKKFGTATGPLLDIGCGTGAHARALAEYGWIVAGVDIAPEMIELARDQSSMAAGLEFFVGAAAEFNLGRLFPAAISLFHVASYQAGEGELLRMFENVRRHLASGGVFIFDFWNGPGVLADPPVVRVRRLENERLRVTRIAEPAHHREKCTIDVNYEVFIEDVATRSIERIKELHRMRYFFLPELKAMLEKTGFAIEETRSGLTDCGLNEQAWYGLIVARAG